MSTKYSVLPISIEFQGGFSRQLNVPRKMTVGKLLQQIREHSHIPMKYRHENLVAVGFVTKSGDIQADYWLSDENRTLEPFRKNTILEVVYKNLDQKQYKTEIRNYSKIGIQDGATDAIVVRGNLDSKLYMIRQFKKESFSQYEDLSKILHIQSFYSQNNDLRCLPRLWKTFESKKNFNFLLEYVPLEINPKLSIDRMKEIISKAIVVLGQLYRIGFGYVEFQISDFRMTFASHVKMVNICRFSSLPFEGKQINFGQQCYHLIYQMVSRIERQLDTTSTQIFGFRKNISEEEYENSRESAIRLFIGFEFQEFMSEICNGKYRHISDITKGGKCSWLYSKTQKFSLKNELKFPARSFNYGQTVRNQFQEDQGFRFQPINRFFEWENSSEEEFWKFIECRTVEKRKPKVAKKCVLKKNKSKRLLANKLLKIWIK